MKIEGYTERFATATTGIAIPRVDVSPWNWQHIKVKYF